MTKNHYKFLKLIRNDDKSAEEICKMMRIKSLEASGSIDISGYYNALNEAIGYLVSDKPGEIDDCFTIQVDDPNCSNKDRYYITQNGKDLFDKERAQRRQFIIDISAIVIAVISIGVAIVLRFI